MIRVVVVGSINQDLTVTVSSLPKPGETVLGSQLALRPGRQGR